MQPYGSHGMIRSYLQICNYAEGDDRPAVRYEIEAKQIGPRGRLPLCPDTCFVTGGGFPSNTLPDDSPTEGEGLDYYDLLKGTVLGGNSIPTRDPIIGYALPTEQSGQIFNAHVSDIISGDIKWFVDSLGKTNFCFVTGKRKFYCYKIDTVTLSPILQYKMDIPAELMKIIPKATGDSEFIQRTIKMDPKRSVIANGKFFILISYCDWEIRPGKWVVFDGCGANDTDVTPPYIHFILNNDFAEAMVAGFDIIHGAFPPTMNSGVTHNVEIDDSFRILNYAHYLFGIDLVNHEATVPRLIFQEHLSGDMDLVIQPLQYLQGIGWKAVHCSYSCIFKLGAKWHINPSHIKIKSDGTMNGDEWEGVPAGIDDVRVAPAPEPLWIELEGYPYSHYDFDGCGTGSDESINWWIPDPDIEGNPFPSPDSPSMLWSYLKEYSTLPIQYVGYDTLYMPYDPEHVLPTVNIGELKGGTFDWSYKTAEISGNLIGFLSWDSWHQTWNLYRWDTTTFETYNQWTPGSGPLPQWRQFPVEKGTQWGRGIELVAKAVYNNCLSTDSTFSDLCVFPMTVDNVTTDRIAFLRWGGGVTTPFDPMAKATENPANTMGELMEAYSAKSTQIQKNNHPGIHRTARMENKLYLHIIDVNATPVNPVVIAIPSVALENTITIYDLLCHNEIRPRSVWDDLANRTTATTLPYSIMSADDYCQGSKAYDQYNINAVLGGGIGVCGKNQQLVIPLKKGGILGSAFFVSSLGMLDGNISHLNWHDGVGNESWCDGIYEKMQTNKLITGWAVVDAAAGTILTYQPENALTKGNFAGSWFPRWAEYIETDREYVIIGMQKLDYTDPETVTYKFKVVALDVESGTTADIYTEQTGIITPGAVVYAVTGDVRVLFSYYKGAGNTFGLVSSYLSGSPASQNVALGPYDQIMAQPNEEYICALKAGTQVDAIDPADLTVKKTIATTSNSISCGINNIVIGRRDSVVGDTVTTKVTALSSKSTIPVVTAWPSPAPLISGETTSLLPFVYGGQNYFINNLGNVTDAAGVLQAEHVGAPVGNFTPIGSATAKLKIDKANGFITAQGTTGAVSKLKAQDKL